MPFTYYRPITVDHTKVTADQTDFPMLVSTTDNDFRSVGNGGKVQHASAHDLCFFADAGLSTALHWEIERYNPTTGEVIAWVKIPSLSSSVDTVIWVAYGDSGISTFQSTASSVWDSNFKGVWHLAETSGTTSPDSTSGANTGAKTSSNEPNPSAGKTGGGQDFDGANDVVTVADSASLDTLTAAYTMSLWFNLDAWNDGIYGLHRLIQKTSSGFDGWVYSLNHNYAGLGTSNFFFSNSSIKSSDSDIVSPGAWLFATVTWDGTTLRFYVNGSAAGTAATAAITVNNDEMLFGNSYSGGSHFFNGKMDEVRLSNAARASDWISTEYANQNAPGTFYALGSEISIASGHPFAARLSTVPFLGGSRARAF